MAALLNLVVVQHLLSKIQQYQLPLVRVIIPVGSIGLMILMIM